jgi:hypothetical protein
MTSNVTVNGLISGLPNGCVVTLQFKKNGVAISSPFQKTVSGGVAIFSGIDSAVSGNHTYGFDVVGKTCADCTIANQTISYTNNCP